MTQLQRTKDADDGRALRRLAKELKGEVFTLVGPYPPESATVAWWVILDDDRDFGGRTIVEAVQRCREGLR